MVNQLHITGLYAIADTQYLDDARLITAVGQAIAGGAQIIQFRDKSHTAVNEHGRRRKSRGCATNETYCL